MNTNPYYLARKRKGLKAARVCVDLDIAVCTLQRWETGKHKPSETSFAKLCKYYGVSADDFLEPVATV